MKKLLLMSSLLTAMAVQAQESAQKTFYWPVERVTELTDNTQYFIYNTANDGQDRSVLLYSDGSALKTNNVSPQTFITTENKYLFTTKKPTTPTDPTHWYLNSIHGIVGHGGKTNNTEARDIYIARWFGNQNITKSPAKSEDEQGTLQNPDNVDTKVFAVTETNGKNSNNSGNYAWNGNAAGDNSWTRYSDAHPYAFYTVKSVTLEGKKAAYYNGISERNGIASEIAYNIQKLHGLVKDGSKYFSNYPETKPEEHSSYANLVDGNDGTYFHSSWSAAGEDTDPKHYLRAELPEATQKFYIVNKRRMDNNNNRPTSILVEGSDAADGTYTAITTLQNLPTIAEQDYYISEQISASAAYKFIRFTPEATNTSSRFFTYSEFYIIESTPESDALIADLKDCYDTPNRNPKDENFVASYDETKYDKMLAVQEKLRLTLAKNELKALLDDNTSNHAEDPALGQYPTSAYNALKAISEKADATSDEVNAAIKTFKFSINAPVFTIDGAFAGSYNTTGKSIYYKADDATKPLWWNKKTNNYDKKMLWKFAGYAETSAEAGKTYRVMNLSDDVFFWNVEYLNVTATDPANEDGIVLIKTQGNNTPVHADGYGHIVRWNASSPTSASAWKITYVGESKMIEKINEDQLAAYAALIDLVPNAEPYSGHIGSGLNQFSCEGHDFEAALNAGKKVLEQDIYKNPDLDALTAKNELQAAMEALTLNQPEAGKYYRIKSKSSGKYISSEKAENGNLKLVDAANDASTVFFLSADKKLTNSKVLNMKGASVSENELGDSYDFQAHNDRGMYLIKPSSSNPLYDHSATSGAVDIWGTNPAAEAKCAWILEEVDEAAQQPKLTKEMTAEYATLAAPVALNIPTGVKAYTVTVDEAKKTAILNEVADVIPAGVAVLLKKEGAASNFDFTYAPEGATDNENALVGVYKETAVGGDINAYILGNVNEQIGFYQMDKTDRTLGANKAYLVLPKEAQAIRSIVIGGPTTGIEETVAESTEAEEYYDLQGRRVMNPTKGIYVTKSGKKVIFNK